MHFLVNQNTAQRLLLQVEAYQNTQVFRLANELCGINLFQNKRLNLSIELIDSLKITKKLRLGNRVERFFEFLLINGSSYQVLAKSLQVVQNKITIGELDFLVRDKEQNRYLHIEIANKFYLYDPNISLGNEAWIGPNRNDSLIQKCEKLRNKQFPLLFHPKTKELLQEKSLDVECFEQELNFKAQLFLPWKTQLKIDGSLSGYYVSLVQFQSSYFQDLEYFIPEKQDWFVAPKNGEIWFSHKEAIDSVLLHFEDKKSPLIWVKKPNLEFEKLFVVWW